MMIIRPTLICLNLQIYVYCTQSITYNIKRDDYDDDDYITFPEIYNYKPKMCTVPKLCNLTKIIFIY